MHFEQVVLETG